MKPIPLLIVFSMTITVLAKVGYGLDRITLNTGELFLGTIIDEKFSRYHIDRYGFISIIPTWEVKQIEKNQSRLPISVASVPITRVTDSRSIIVAATETLASRIPENLSRNTNPSRKWEDPFPENMRVFSLMGKAIPVVSAPPAEPSHLETVPRNDYLWMTQNRFLRGYLVNRTENGYHSIQIEIKYFVDMSNSKGVTTEAYTNIHQSTEIFHVYPMTMKPLRVDTRFVPWEKVKQIQFQIVGRKPMMLP